MRGHLDICFQLKVVGWVLGECLSPHRLQKGLSPHSKGFGSERPEKTAPTPALPGTTGYPEWAEWHLQCRDGGTFS